MKKCITLLVLTGVLTVLNLARAEDESFHYPKVLDQISDPVIHDAVREQTPAFDFLSPGEQKNAYTEALDTVQRRVGPDAGYPFTNREPYLATETRATHTDEGHERYGRREGRDFGDRRGSRDRYRGGYDPLYGNGRGYGGRGYGRWGRNRWDHDRDEGGWRNRRRWHDDDDDGDRFLHRRERGGRWRDRDDDDDDDGDDYSHPANDFRHGRRWSHDRNRDHDGSRGSRRSGLGGHRRVNRLGGGDSRSSAGHRSGNHVGGGRSHRAP